MSTAFVDHFVFTRAAYTEVWSQLWHQETGQRTSGGLLRARLHQLMVSLVVMFLKLGAIMLLQCGQFFRRAYFCKKTREKQDFMLQKYGR